MTGEGEYFHETFVRNHSNLTKHTLKYKTIDTPKIKSILKNLFRRFLTMECSLSNVGIDQYGFACVLVNTNITQATLHGQERFPGYVPSFIVPTKFVAMMNSLILN
jgi:hypothetical protein